METQTKVLNWDEFEKEYSPLKNMLRENASLDGCMFETYGEEHNFVRQVEINHIWTFLEDDEGEMVLVSGYHWVNRQGYVVTKKGHSDNAILVVND